MSIWSRIAEALKALSSGEGLSALFERLRTPPERSVAFTIAVISLAAKMAKADGTVTVNEVRAFREVFYIAPQDESQAAQVFNLARQDVAGFELYAARIGKMFAEDRVVLENLLEGLFHISMADGIYHEQEDLFLREVANRFNLPEASFRAIRARYVPDAVPDPYDVLGVTQDMPIADIRTRWRQLVRETHPDALIARGMPEEAIQLATKRLHAINDAWSAIQGAA
ncbi:TerB family tellurite resistance protein [Halovulum sp. GXIMD14793]